MNNDVDTVTGDGIGAYAIFVGNSYSCEAIVINNRMYGADRGLWIDGAGKLPAQCDC
jgi:hypothetical protein